MLFVFGKCSSVYNQSGHQHPHCVIKIPLPEPLNTCPVCAACISVHKPVGGIWTGGVRCRATNGPMYGATCQACETKLLACPTYEEAEAGKFFWEHDEPRRTV